MSIPDIINGVIEREAGYSNHPSDRGGETMWGITKAEAFANGWTGSMRDMPRSWAETIYLRKYVSAPGYDKIAAVSVSIAEEMIDTGVNMGTSIPGPWLQRTLNALNQRGKLWPDLVVDGKIGPATVAALQAHIKHRGKTNGEAVILRSLNCLQGARYIEITESRPANEDFFYGWVMNRVEVK